MLTETTHRQPVIRFVTTTRRRVFMLVAANGFVLASLGCIVAGPLMLVHNFTEFTTWILAALVVIGGMMGSTFIGRVAIAAWKTNLGADGATSLIVSPVGLTDRTQIVGPLPMIPWSMVSQYDVVQHHERASLVLWFHDVEAYKRLIEPYRFFGWLLTVDPEDTGTLVHSVNLEYIQASPEEIGRTIQQLTGLSPGVRPT